MLLTWATTGVCHPPCFCWYLPTSLYLPSYADPILSFQVAAAGRDVAKSLPFILQVLVILSLFTATGPATPFGPAMIILNCSVKLQVLEGMLRRSLPEALSVCGAVMHINRGNPAQHEVVVDSWPEFKVVLTRPHKEVVKDSLDFYSNLHAAFYREVDACRALLNNAEAIDWSKAFQLQGLQDGMYEAARDIAEARHIHLEPYRYQTALHPSPPTSFESRLKNEFFHFGILSPSHAVLLNETWSVGRNDRSLRYLEHLICHYPNACLMDKEGQLVSWTLSDPLACLTHAYTLPQYRGQGCAELVTLATAEKMHVHGFPIYAGTLPENQAAQQTLRKQGFHFLPWTMYMLLFTPSF